MANLQFLVILIFAPLLQGFIKKTKAMMQGRCGFSIFQPYYDLFRLFKKDMVISNVTSYIFRITPYIVLASSIVVTLMLPIITTKADLPYFGDVIAIVYTLALARFFMALAGLDAGTAFGGEGSSREMTVATLVEPMMILCLFTAAVSSGSTNISQMIMSKSLLFTPSKLLAFSAFIVVTIAETGRIPVDNPDTHLELTMIHEGMLLEYSGRYLAMMEYAHYIKQMFLYTLIVDLFFPLGIAQTEEIIDILIALCIYLLKVFIIGFGMALIESTRAKMRFFQLPALLGSGFVLAFVSLLTYLMLGR